MAKYLTRTIWILSLISLFTDTASEMLYPVLPVFLESIGFSVVLIGILEGIAEATAGLCKGYFGKLSDNSGKRAPFVQLGYSLSAISKPMMAVFVKIKVFIAISGFLIHLNYFSVAQSTDSPQWGQKHSRNMISDEKGLPEQFNPGTDENIK